MKERKSKVTGRCLCSAVHFECTEEPVMAGNCHCRDCQRASGAAYITALFFPKESVSIFGDLRFFDVKADSGNTFSRGFCPSCGSGLFGRSTGFPHLIGVRAMSLDDPERFPPEMNIFVDSAPEWHVLSDELPRYSRGPDR